MKSALARGAGVDPKSMRYVAFEGGGEAMTALMGGHVQVYSGDASEGRRRSRAVACVLAVLAPIARRANWRTIPTAKEQGYDVEWPIIRGYYVGPKVSDADYKWWVATFDKMLASPEFALRAEGLFPFARTGARRRRLREEGARQALRRTREFGMVAQ